MANLNAAIALNAIGKRLVFTIIEEAEVDGLIVDQARDLSSATALWAQVRDPSGATTSISGSLLTDGTDGKFFVVSNPSTATVWDKLGEWTVRATFSGPGFSDSSRWQAVEVY